MMCMKSVTQSTWTCKVGEQMTKKDLKKEMLSLINVYYQKADEKEDEEWKQMEYLKIAGIETLAARLNIKLWSDDRGK